MDKFLVIDLEMDLRSARADFEKKYLTAQINNFNGNKLRLYNNITSNILSDDNFKSMINIFKMAFNF